VEGPFRPLGKLGPFTLGNGYLHSLLIGQLGRLEIDREIRQPAFIVAIVIVTESTAVLMARVGDIA
jgi:hypothetical protein